MSRDLESSVGLGRREFLKRAGLGAILGTSGMALGVAGDQKLTEPSTHPYKDINAYKKGYPEVWGQHEKDIFQSLGKTDQATEILYQSGNVIQGIFHGNPEFPNYLLFSGEPDSNYSLNVMEVTINGKRFIVPMIQGEDFSQASLFVADMSGPQFFTVRNLNVSFPDQSDLFSVRIQGHAITGDPFLIEAVRNTPIFNLRDENQLDETVTNDIPCSDELIIGEGFHGISLQEILLQFSAEDEGSSPDPLAENEGRLRDYDSLYFIKSDQQGSRTEQAYSIRGHKVVVDKSVNGTTLKTGERTTLQIYTGNNMVDDKEGEPNKRCVSFLPDRIQLKLGDLTYDKINRRNFALDVISIRENLSQGLISRDHEFVEYFIREQLHGNAALIEDYIH